MQIVNLSRGILLAKQAHMASTFLARTRGLLGKTHIPEDEALIITPCNSIHTFFMMFAIDAVFLDPSKKVLLTRENLVPFRLVLPIKNASYVIELPTGTLKKTGTRPGDFISFEVRY